MDGLPSVSKVAVVISTSCQKEGVVIRPRHRVRRPGRREVHPAIALNPVRAGSSSDSMWKVAGP